METYNQYRNLIGPTLLTEKEITDPYLVIRNLFDATSPEYLRNELWEMAKTSLLNSCWSFMSDPSIVIDRSKEIVRLFDGMYLLLKKHEQENGEVQFHPAEPFSERKFEQDKAYVRDLKPILNTFSGRIQRLSKKEIQDPFLAIKEFFNLHSPGQWKEILSEWSHYSLSSESLAESREELTVIAELEQTEKLFEAAYLIHLAKNKNLRTAKCLEEDILIRYFPEKEALFTPALKEALISFLTAVSPERLNITLRKMLLDFMRHNINGLPVDFSDYLTDLEYLTEMLDKAEMEIRNWPKEEE